MSEKVPEALLRSLAEQQHRFEKLVDRVVPVDITPAQEGFADANYGGPYLKQTLLDVLPGAYRHTLLSLEEATRDLQDLYARHALPHIIGYSTLAATAGAVPIPWIDLLILPAIQGQMINHLARYYGQPLSGRRFAELAGSVSAGVLTRQATRELMKLVPFAGSVAGSAWQVLPPSRWARLSAITTVPSTKVMCRESRTCAAITANS